MFPVAASRLPVNRRRLGWIALACSAAGLAMGLSACGGGSRNSFFAPNRIVSFGDENSAFSDFTSPSFLNANGSGNAVVKGLVYTVQEARVNPSVVCDNPPRALNPGEVAAECGTANGTFGTLASTAYYSFVPAVPYTSTKLELDGAGKQRTTSTLYDCSTPRIWVHVLASAYGRGFTSQCAIDTRGGAISYAAFGAKTDDVINQINTRRGELGSGVLVTIMVGQNDILEQFNAIRASTTSEAAAIAELQARADRMANAVKDAIGTGAKVVLALTPSLNNSPKAVASVADADLLSKLVVAYNDRLYVRGLGNVSGRDLVGVNPDSFTNTTTRNNSYNYVTPLCPASGLTKPDGIVTTGSEPDADANVRFCNTAGPLNGSIGTLMWADTVRFGPLGHSLIGSLAYNRARQQF